MSDERDLELAGDRMTYTETTDGSVTMKFDNKGTGRICGSCQLCCKLLPVPTLGKPASQRCQHQRHGKGCAIYADRPYACRTWSCRWVSDRIATEGMPRPDRCHYVIDIVPDHVDLTNNDTGVKQRINVITVWVDPAYRDAYRAPELRAFMLRMAQQYLLATIVRWSSTDAVTIFPPPLDEGGEWHEMRGNIVQRDHEDMLEMASRMRVVTEDR